MKPGLRPDNLPLDRPAHYLRGSTSAGWPACSVALSVVSEAPQCPSVAAVHELRFRSWAAIAWTGKGAAESSSPVARGTDAPSFWRWLLQLQAKHGSVWVWQLGACHGLTMLGFWERLERGEWSILGMSPVGGRGIDTAGRPNSAGVCVVSDPPTIILARRSQTAHTTRFLDVRNLGVSSWSELDGRPGDAATLAWWLRSWYVTVDELKLGGLRSTAAAQAWHGWRHSYLTEPLLVHNDDRAIRFERAALHPGRCEAVRIGRTDGPIYQCDASAMYPACALSHTLPVRFAKIGTDGYAGANLLHRRGYCIIAKCRVRTGIPTVPVRHDGLTLWPVGTFSTTLCWPEIGLLRRYGCRVEISEYAAYEPGRPFNAYFSALWDCRKELERLGGAAPAGCVKRLMNSLVGKCASWDWAWMPWPLEWPLDSYATWYGLDPRTRPDTLKDLSRAVARGDPGARERLPICRWRSIGWHCQYERCEGEDVDSMPALTAWVCSLARVKLWEWIRCAGRDHVIYYDTDSVWTDTAGYNRLVGGGHIRPGVCGGLRAVKMHEWVDVRGCKYYITPDGVVCAGISSNAAIATEGGFRWWSPERLPDSLRSQRAPRAVSMPYSAPADRPYRHGNVASDGTVTPIRLDL